MSKLFSATAVLSVRHKAKLRQLGLRVLSVAAVTSSTVCESGPQKHENPVLQYSYSSEVHTSNHILYLHLKQSNGLGTGFMASAVPLLPHPPPCCRDCK